MNNFDNEERILGPFNFKQLGIIAFGFVIFYYAKTLMAILLAQIPTGIKLIDNIDILVFVFVAVIVIRLVLKNKPPTIDREYIDKKRYLYTNKEDYTNWLKSKIETRQNEIAMRNSKGMVPDSRLEQELRDLQQVFDKERVV